MYRSGQHQKVTKMCKYLGNFIAVFRWGFEAWRILNLWGPLVIGHMKTLCHRGAGNPGKSTPFVKKCNPLHQLVQPIHCSNIVEERNEIYWKEELNPHSLQKVFIVEQKTNRRRPSQPPLWTNNLPLTLKYRQFILYKGLEKSLKFIYMYINWFGFKCN